jgi:hypothetical protein
MARWEDHRKEDLRMIPTMEAAGWKVKFHHMDIHAKRTSPDNVPNHGVSFEKGNLHVWGTIEGYQVAELIGTMYENHRGTISYNRKGTLEDRFPHTRGYIPDLETLLQLDAAGEL